MNSLDATKKPACANIILQPIAFIKLLLPDAFVPYNNIPSFPVPNSISFVM